MGRARSPVRADGGAGCRGHERAAGHRDRPGRRLGAGRAARRRDRLGPGARDRACRGIRSRRDFLAIEVFRAGLARTMLDAERAGLQNLRLVEANAPEVLAAPAAGGIRLGAVGVLPRPVAQEQAHEAPPGRRRSSRRSRPAAVRDGGMLRLATDWEDYALQMRDVLDDAPEFDATSRGSGRRASTAAC